MSVPADLPPLILRPRALADGYDDKEIARHRRSGVWSSVRRGAYVGSASAEALTRRSRHRLLIEATLSKLRRPAWSAMRQPRCCTASRCGLSR